MLRVTNIKISLDQSDVDLKKVVAHKLRVSEDEIEQLHIYKKSLDARKSMNASSVYTIDVVVSTEIEERLVALKIPTINLSPSNTYVGVTHGMRKLRRRPVVVGFGPAGMFAALLLAQEGYRPIIIERGGKVEKRLASVAKFWEKGELDENCNVQFGEGGAGTFSDGKLTTRVKDERIHKVLDELVKAGANEKIKYDHMPHIGSDCLVEIVKVIREEIINLGGTFHFDTLVEDFVIENGVISGVVTKKGLINSNTIILAIGHSARDTYEILHKRQVSMEAKPFAVGLRIEHPQNFINQNQYKGIVTADTLEAATYRLTHQATNQRGVYTFCMCPGGVVVPSTSQKGCVVTNGMSYASRDLENANAGILVQVSCADFGSDALDGVRFQEKIEKHAFSLTNNTYKAPCQKAGDYLINKVSSKLDTTKPSYNLNVELCDLNVLFPEYINTALKEGLEAFDKKIPGFIENGVLSGPETRSSAPLRIIRKENLQSANIKGLYPCGEGAGYAGGIVSAAIDGLRIAEQLIKEYQPFTSEE